MSTSLLCKRDMKVSNDVFENGCVRNITSLNFIFNMSKNKSQYEKNTFKGMQFAFWQTVIEVGGRYAEFPISSEFL